MQTLGAGADGSVEGAGIDLRDVRPRFAQARHATPPTACWRAGWPSAACASSSSSIAAGTSTAICRARSAAVPGHRPALRGADSGSEAARACCDDTLVVWGGEFGRTVYSQGDADRRQLRPRSSSALLHHAGWPAAASSGRPHVRRDRRLLLQHRARIPVHVHDLHATILHCLGIDHTRLTFKFQGRHFRLTDVHGKVVREILA